MYVICSAKRRKIEYRLAHLNWPSTERRLEEQRLQREQEEMRWRRELEFKEPELEFKRETAEREAAQKDNVATL